MAAMWVACQPAGQNTGKMEVQEAVSAPGRFSFSQMDKDTLYDKVLGMLVGSAIGDAMGAPTEMWNRNMIRVEYGHVDSLDDMVREPSPEGTWDVNLPAGGTTDDTRWKVLLAEYVLQHGEGLYQEAGPDPFVFARFLMDRYEQEIQALQQTDSYDPAPIEYRARRMAWLQEWAVVAKPFAEQDLEAYTHALDRFYGGEMVCAGLLYAPMVGLVYPGDGEAAYRAAYRLGIFDLGYARDISALSAAMVAAAMDPQATPATVLAVLRDVDPQGYFQSRLVGRSSYRLYRDLRYMVDEAQSLSKEEIALQKIRLPLAGRDTLYVARTQRLYEALDARNQDMPFHAGEIHMINLAGLMFGQFDFRKSLEFVINYGRDNDTVGAVTGAILGAYHGYSRLPQDWVAPVLETNKSRLGIDLEVLARQLTEQMWASGAVSG